MKLDRTSLFSLVIGLFLLTLTPEVTNAAVTGNIYYFSDTWHEQIVQVDSGPAYQSSDYGQFRITIYNQSELGGKEVYHYNYNGFYSSSWGHNPYTYYNHNDTVAFQDNIVHFSLFAEDYNDNNRADACYLGIYPYEDPNHPGQTLFVNTNWSAYELWDNAQEEVENNSFVDQSLTSFSNPGDGTFYFTIVVNIDTRMTLSGQFQDWNGTYTYTLSSSYDLDGVLLNYMFSTREQLFNENHTCDWTIVRSITRIIGVGPDLAPIFNTLITIIVVACVAFPLGVLFGIQIRRRRRVGTSQE